MKRKLFEEQILPLRDKLFRIALRITYNRDEAEDVVQDVMMKIWQLKDQWDEIQCMDAYCCMMSRNMAIRMASMNNKYIDNPAEATLALIVEEDHSPQEAMEEAEVRKMLRDFISQLPEKEKTVMGLRDIESMSYKEIAETLGVTEAQVKINLFRARQKVKALFAKVR